MAFYRGRIINKFPIGSYVKIKDEPLAGQTVKILDCWYPNEAFVIYECEFLLNSDTGRYIRVSFLENELEVLERKLRKCCHNCTHCRPDWTTRKQVNKCDFIEVIHDIVMQSCNRFDPIDVSKGFITDDGLGYY